jgi:hypothetical protein
MAGTIYTGPGLVRVYSGSDGAVLYEFHGAPGQESLGYSLGVAGDVDRDGFPDPIVGAPLAMSTAGRALVFSGLDGSLLRDWQGDAAGDWFGIAVDGVGDLDLDGSDDVIVGAAQFRTSPPFATGYARVFSGMDGSLLHELSGDAEKDGFGWSVSGTADFDGDQVGDVIVGSSARYAKAFSGRDGSLLYTIRTGSPYGILSVGGTDDVDGDGLAELLVGDRYAGLNGQASVYSLGSAQRSNYGSGWPGTLGVPALTSWGLPAICSTIELRIGNSFGHFTQGALFVGSSSASLPTGWDGTLLVLPLLAFPVVAIPSGGSSSPVTIVCDPSLIGVGAYLQVLEVDPGASRGVSFTPGLLLVVGT